jgi:hypothetical protein
MNNLQGEGTPVAPQKITTNLTHFESNNQAALYWFYFGFNVIPIRPDSKQPAIEWVPWLEDLSSEIITNYWSENPDSEVGFIVGDDIIVFDTDSQESIIALAEIEETFDLTPNLVVKTKKGEHHYYRRAKGTFAISDSHCAKDSPNRIDVKTGHAIVMLPPSKGKEIEIREVYNVYNLTEIDQVAIDAVCSHNAMLVSRPQESLSQSQEGFELANPITIGTPNSMVEAENKVGRNSLDKYSLRGTLEEMERLNVDAVYVLGQIALLGQLTAIYAAPNSGKTLLILWLLIERIKDGRIDPSNIYYINVDDDHNGLTEKLHLAEEYGFHMLSDGYQNFDTDDFLRIMRDMIEKDQAHGVIIILDTLKKFTDLMDKRKSSNFTTVVRQFALKGGTLIALAHTNKHLGSSGKLVYGGTNDIMCDFDCAYTLDIVSDKNDERIVVFENTKRRGSVVKSAAYSYSTEDGIAYPALLLSVASIDESQIDSLKVIEQQKSDAEIIGMVKACISEGINSKMKLADAIAERARVSKRNALKIIDKYTGENQEQHIWKFTVRDRGAKMYVLLEA